MKLKLLNAIKCDLNKSIINIGFAGAVLLTTVLAFTSSAYTDLATDKSYSVFESLFTLDKNILRTDPMLSGFQKRTFGIYYNVFAYCRGIPFHGVFLCRAK